MQTLVEQRYIGVNLLTGRMDARGGAVGYESIEGIFADGTPEIVAPGAEYTLTTVQDGAANLARVVKWGKDTIITDEAIARRNTVADGPVEKSLLKLANSAVKAIDSAVISVVASGITATQAATAVWTGTSAKTLLDILVATSTVRSNAQGYNPDVLLVDDVAWAYMAADSTIAQAMARENSTNPIYSGRFDMIAGLQIIRVPAANLPGGVGTSAWVLDSSQLGFIATEDLGGGYQSAGALVQTKVMRTDETDGWRLRARSIFVPVVTDPGAGIRITGVRA